MEIDDIRLKEVDELSDDEKGFLREHREDLTDEEMESFKGVLEEKKEDEDDKGFSFKSQEELDKYLEEKLEERLEVKEKERQEEEERIKREKETGEEEFFPKDYKATNWDEAFKKVYPKLEEKILGKLGKMNAEQKAKVEEINKTFDKQIDDILAKNKDLPEREDLEKELNGIVLKFKGVTDMNEAFEIYKAVKSAENKDKQKDLAKKIGSGGGGEKGEEDKRKYLDVHTKSLDELMDEEIEKLGV